MFDIRLRCETEADECFLRKLYASTRSEEMAFAPWPDAQKTLFLNQQFDLQRHHYRQHFPNTEFMVICIGDTPAGRWYLQRDLDAFVLIDIALLPAHRGQGLGSYLLNKLLTEAAELSKPVRLHVENHNRAQNLYRRLGFCLLENQGLYSLLEWRPKPAK